MPTDEMLILVDGNDVPVGFDTKLDIHKRGALHRAFSVLIFDGRGRLMLQRRARRKYHSAGLWTNTCCGHPRPGEETGLAAKRRLREEMGFDCDLGKVAAFTYRALLPNGLVEHEYDHVYVGRFDGEPEPDPAEASEWRWLDTTALREAVAARPDDFTIWFREMLARAPHDGIEHWRTLAVAMRPAGELALHPTEIAARPS